MTILESKPIGRRQFLGISLAAAGAVCFDLRLGEARADEVAEPIEINSWVLITPDNRVKVRIPQSEIGQGATTALTQLIADELDLDLAQVDWEIYDPQLNRMRNNVYVHTATIASFAIELLSQPMRIAGAQIRDMLGTAAAARLGVAKDQLVYQGHVISVRDGDGKATYFEAAQGLSGMAVPAAVTLKEQGELRYIGKSIPRMDSVIKSTGQAKYGIDTILPGMKYAAVRQSPVFGGRLRSYDFDAIRSMPGVIGVAKIKAGPSGYTVPPILWDIIDWEMDDAVAVVADSWWIAKEALEVLPIEWDNPPEALVSSADIGKRLSDALASELQVVREEGEIGDRISGAARSVKAEYNYPYLEHAPLEPMNATALYKPGTIEVWASTQYGEEALRIAAYAAGVALKDATCHVTLSGGAFGRRLHNDYVSQAVQVARAYPGTPIKLIASREENFKRSYYPPVMKATLEAALNEDGSILAWDSKVVQARSVFQPYGMSRLAVPTQNVRVAYGNIDAPPPFGWMRGVGHTQNAWMNQGFVSELAAEAGMSTLDYLLAQLDPSKVDQARPDHGDAVSRIERFRTVLADLVELAGPEAETGKGAGRGYSIHDMSYMPGLTSSCIAIALDVRLDGKGGLVLEKAYASVDCGLAINPEIVEGQIAGGIIFGLSNAMYGKITLENGEVEQSNFHDYPVMRMNQAPDIVVRVMESTSPSKGVGEGAVPVVLGALVDAIYAAGGPRVRNLPVIDNDLKLRG